MTYTLHYNSPVGRILLAGREDALTGLWLEGQKYFAATLPAETAERETPLLRQTAQWLDRYFAGKRPALTELPLAPEGSAFRREVWQLLGEIPYGEVTTYGGIAAKLAAPRGAAHVSAQAVGGAVGHNPIAILIPCHRVVGADGSLTGYAGGIAAKQWLLAHEGVDPARFFVPGEKRPRA